MNTTQQQLFIPSQVEELILQLSKEVHNMYTLFNYFTNFKKVGEIHHSQQFQLHELFPYSVSFTAELKEEHLKEFELDFFQIQVYDKPAWFPVFWKSENTVQFKYRMEAFVGKVYDKIQAEQLGKILPLYSEAGHCYIIDLQHILPDSGRYLQEGSELLSMLQDFTRNPYLISGTDFPTFIKWERVQGSENTYKCEDSSEVHFLKKDTSEDTFFTPLKEELTERNLEALRWFIREGAMFHLFNQIEEELELDFIGLTEPSLFNLHELEGQILNHTEDGIFIHWRGSTAQPLSEDFSIVDTVENW